jgi:hypothetical protein
MPTPEGRGGGEKSPFTGCFKIKRQKSKNPTKGIKLSPRLRFLNWLEQNYGIEIGKFKTYKIIK